MKTRANGSRARRIFTRLAGYRLLCFQGLRAILWICGVFAYIESEREAFYLLKLIKVEMTKIVSAYLENTVSDLEIADWANEVRIQFMRNGQLLDLDKIPYIRFLKTIGRLRDDVTWREIQRDDILYILDVLLGRINASHTMRFQVPFAFEIPKVQDAFNNLRPDAAHMEAMKKILESQLKNNKLTNDDVAMLRQFNTDKPNRIVTVLDLISTQIKAEINSFDIQDNCIIADMLHIHLLFPTDLMRDETLSISRLIRLIDCYLGYDYFNIFCLFKSGIPYLSLLP